MNKHISLFDQRPVKKKLYVEKENFTSQSKVKLVDLFAGIGGFHYGINRAAKSRDLQVEPLLVSEIEESCQEVYKENFHCEVQGDITKIDFKKYMRKNKLKAKSTDILTAGFPCQPFSNSGRKNGLSDPRGKFLAKIIEGIDAFKPKTFILENVPGIGTNGGRPDKAKLAFKEGQSIGHSMQMIEKKLEELNKYQVQWVQLDSSNFGSPQVRNRIYIIGIRKDIFKKSATTTMHKLVENLDRTKGKSKEFIDIADKKIDESLKINKQEINLKKDMRQGKQPSYKNGMRRVGKAYYCPGGGGNVGQGYHAYGKVPTLTKVWARFLPIYFPHEGEIPPESGVKEIKIGEFYGEGYFRRASVSEVMKLQGFQPNDFKPHKVARIAYEHAGNSVNVNVVRAIADQLLKLIL